MLVAATVTQAPMDSSTSMAALPTVPQPSTSAWMPGAVPRPLTNFPQPPLKDIMA